MKAESSRLTPLKPIENIELFIVIGDEFVKLQSNQYKCYKTEF